ncbi:ATP-dependent DNA ligase [Rubrivivax gelatinosus]|uniref:ATP dependent DNA ligase n=1 Tax=Rubrivivax gelatinosus (strain NBRC 100245 / IL144) TaxID=983917 RepID=I0HN63_RUBGI|nr:ATP-dependent DNA ligase [Rubrivivax gelatinosus]BAL94450.1 ATP dependent DNA ligase [Rubrivivax gelatinosus IL144]
MRQFAALYLQLDASTATSEKVAALARYFAAAPAEDAAWAVYFLAGGRPRQLVPAAVLRATAQQLAGLDDWLFEACYQAVGDLAETIAHVLPAPERASDDGLAEWVEQRLLPLRGLAPAEQAARLAEQWAALDATGRFLHVKLIGGGFRVGVSRLLVQRALAEASGLDAKCIAQRMMGYTDARATPSAERYRALVAPGEDAATDAGRPYPFFLAHPLQAEPATLGPVADWLAEWKYDGIRAQLVRRAGGCWIWSRGEELVTERFPEVVAAAAALPEGTVLDGEILAWRPGDERPAPFALLQQRIARKTLTKKVLADAPVVFVAYDLLEAGGHDLRAVPQHERRARLEALLAATPLRVSPEVQAPDWAGLAAWRAQARERGVEGLMLKHRAAAYGVGRTKADGVWWKWKIEPYTVDCVLVYAQAGHGRRASVYTDYSFAVWNRTPQDAAEAEAAVEAVAAAAGRGAAAEADPEALRLVPFAKAYSGLSDAEFAAVDRVIRQTTLEKFGPVRSVRPTLVFELGFEGLAESGRHKSGIAVRFPRMLRLRPDKPLHEADTLATLRALLPPAR